MENRPTLSVTKTALMTDKPGNGTNKEHVERMFNDISQNYDMLNNLLSLGIDRRWRKRLIGRLPKEGELLLLDVATGTGDLAIAAALSTNAVITATDIAEKMMEVGRRKVDKLGLNGRIVFQKANAEQLPFPDNTFDALMVGFGVRNFHHFGQGMRELHRVLKPGGQLLVLEFSLPANPMLSKLFRLYFGKILPKVGKLISRHPDAYNYLPESVKEFPYGHQFIKCLQTAGFETPNFTILSSGIAMLYEARAGQNEPEIIVNGSPARMKAAGVTHPPQVGTLPVEK
jgi:demethylmenaquinone methyltransferase / 2-methoxy-6-polyprenyl-1,4-benzoquinol methylase